MAVYVTNGTRTSAGPGPGALRLPPGEAAALVRDKLAVYGETGSQESRAARAGLRG